MKALTDKDYVTPIRSKNRKRPNCFGAMHTLNEENMAAQCLPCRFFNRCRLKSEHMRVLTQGPAIPRQPDADQEYRIKW